ncbi:hypothetical protein P5673_028462 [Acropora cervicornis]|uniref:Uncharacterized protein n=1 Tax=Acropora cervicornis TaxID=6130 RepID=A0AAD9PXA4_ACRCE|nr:hypothetical protein P5673_028462 [Acropora cervicornis]
MEKLKDTQQRQSDGMEDNQSDFLRYSLLTRLPEPASVVELEPKVLPTPENGITSAADLDEPASLIFGLMAPFLAEGQRNPVPDLFLHRMAESITDREFTVQLADKRTKR